MGQAESQTLVGALGLRGNFGAVGMELKTGVSSKTKARTPYMRGCVSSGDF